VQHLVKQETLCRPYAAATARRARARSFVAASCRTSRYPHDPDGAISAKTAEFSACLCGKPISPPRVGKCSEVTAAPHGRWSVSDETSKPLPIWRGTEGSNPSPSSEESGANPESLEAAIAPRWTGCASYDVSWPGNGEPPCEGPMVRIHPPPAVSQQTFGSSPDDARCSIMYHRVDDQPGAGRAGGRVKRCRDRVSRCQSRR